MKRNWGYFIAGQAGVVPVAFGSPGIAKTASCRALATATGREFVSFVLQHHLPEDFGGFPVVTEIEHAGRKLRYMDRVPDRKIVMASLQPSVVLFDELTNAGHALQAAALQIIQDGIPGSWVLGAANPPELAAAGVDFTPPFVNRLCILQWQPDEEGWDEGCRNGFSFPSPNVPVLPENWRDYCTKWGRLLVEFRRRMPDLWNKPPADPAKATEPFPSPRSWTNTGMLCAAAESVQAGEVVQAELVYGCVGVAAGTAFMRWLSDLNLPDPEAILRSPASLKLPARGDMAVAIISSVINRVRENNAPARWEAGREVLDVAWKQSQEVAMAAEGALWKVKPEGYTPVQRHSEMAKARLLSV